MTDHDDVLAEIGSDLEVETSREFVVGVHARLRNAQRRRRIRWALTAAASIGLVSFLVWRPSSQPAAVVASISQPSSPVAVVKTQPAPLAVKALAKARPALTSVEPRLEVITNQGEILRALWAPYGSKPKALTVVTGNETTEEVAAKPILIEPIVVPTIEVKEIGRETARPGIGVPQTIRRNNAANVRETK